ncbi:hypothetical protein Mp_2g12690 [Marchantia polymorpha subsp. ruderalis]|uniref:Uncharacterized protein n=1 Tax=Marchantia polymorpha TaxID=3197 RepID=A0A2R6XAX6_MARPO|nr:hypothetical protein MARPO_0026s0102 [Marchantia polymorpha]BBN02091.1 hypothetical protein Mp_2g12690 [Marchantia polymorpha subsp. ruderalis]|eukprot:PTQ43229.1 hypothetical protein MARPO_0026s0102 [Marchantia polymorpha]
MPIRALQFQASHAPRGHRFLSSREMCRALCPDSNKRAKDNSVTPFNPVASSEAQMLMRSRTGVWSSPWNFGSVFDGRLEEVRMGATFRVWVEFLEPEDEVRLFFPPRSKR